MKFLIRADKKIRLAAALILTTLALSLVFSLFAGVAYAAQKLIQMSSDPFTNSNSQHQTEVEPDAVAWGETVVATFQQGRFTTGGASDNGWATSFDGGVTWTHGSLPGMTVYTGGSKYHRASDPVVAYDAKHRTWMISSYIFDEVTNPNEVAVSLSQNGTVWSNPVTIVQNTSGVFFDKDWIGCDNAPASPYYGHCYDEWDTYYNNTDYNIIDMSTSIDGGKTWGPPTPTTGDFNGTGGQILVQPDGKVIVPILGETPTTYYVAAFTSSNGGITWSKLVKVSNEYVLSEEPRMRTSDGLLTAAIDSSGKVYLAWNDCRFEANCSANDIVLTTSTDGVNWTPVQRIPIDPVGSGVDHFNPGIAVKTFQGQDHIALTYYYFPNTSCTVATCQLDVGFISSANGGASWSTPEQLAGPMKLTWLANTQGRGYFVGDYIATVINANDVALPVIEVATPPSGGLLHENTYTTPEDAFMALTGGPVAVQNENVLVSQPTSSSFPPGWSR